MTILDTNEPLRRHMIPAILVVGVLTALMAWGAGADWRVALGIAAGETLALLGFVEATRGTFTRNPFNAARNHTWGPESHRMAVAYALSLDPDEHFEDLKFLGIENREEALELIGELLPEDQR